jgi:hypothetical protein
MMQAIRATLPGGHVGFFGVPHAVQLHGKELFFPAIHLHSGPAPVHYFLSELVGRVRNCAGSPRPMTCHRPVPGGQDACGTPTWIWSVVVDGALYVRASRWHRAAVRQKAGRKENERRPP